MITFQLKLLLHFPNNPQISLRPSGYVFTARMKNTEGVYNKHVITPSLDTKTLALDQT